MTKKEALQIFGLEGQVNRQMIESRYTRLIKGYSRSDPQKMEAINQAYHVLTEDSRQVKISPRLQKEVAGKSLYHWKNFFYYAKRPAAIAIVVIAIVVAIVYSVVTNEDPDFTVAAIGAFYNRQDSFFEEQENLYTWSEFVIQNMEVTDPFLDVLSIGSDQDPQMEMANVTKRILYAGGMAPADLLLLDFANFESFESEGIYISLEEFYGDLQSRYSEDELAFFEPVYGRISLSEEEIEARNQASDSEDNESDESEDDYDWISDEEYIVGFDFSESQIFNGLALLGYEQILTITVHNEDPELAYDFIEQLIVHQESIFAESPGIVGPSPTPTPFPTAQPTVETTTEA